MEELDLRGEIPSINQSSLDTNNTHYCPAQNIYCKRHRIVNSSIPWKCCTVYTNHSENYERCPYPSKIEICYE